MATTIVSTRPSGGGQPSNTYLTALSTITGTGIYVVTSPTTAELRAITGVAGQIVVTDGDGVAADPLIGLATTTVTPGSYTNTNLTVDAFGRITAAANGSASGGVSQIVAGTNISISPPGGTGVVTINATSGTALQLYAENPVAPSPPNASGTNSIALLSGSHASAQDALAIGVQSLSRIQGGVVQASGRFASSGDAQAGRYMMRINTINSVPTPMWIDGNAASVPLTMQDNSTWTFRITVVAHRTDTSGGHAGYEFSGVIFRDSGAASTAIQGGVNKTVIAESNTPWDANVSADTTHGGISVVVTGQSSKTIRWVALIETVEITN